MGRRKREHREMVQAGLEEAFRNDNVNLAVKQVEDTYKDMSLPEQVKEAYKLLEIIGLSKFKKDFLQAKGFPSDIENKKKSGMSNDDVYNYYWGCVEFMQFWHDIGMNEDNLRNLIYK